MTLEQLIDAAFPLLFGFAGMYLAICAHIAMRRRNREIEETWEGKRHD